MINVGKALTAAVGTVANVLVPGSGSVVSGVANEVVGSWTIGTSADPIFDVGTPTKSEPLVLNPEWEAWNSVNNLQKKADRFTGEVNTTPEPKRYLNAPDYRGTGSTSGSTSNVTTGGSMSAPSSVSLGSALEVTKQAAMSPIGIVVMVLVAGGMAWKWYGNSNHP
jgi:hypothetical protein